MFDEVNEVFHYGTEGYVRIVNTVAEVESNLEKGLIASVEGACIVMKRTIFRLGLD
jgi:hypothetical protein